MDPITIILGILQLLAALPEIIEAIQFIWDKIRGIEDRAERMRFRKALRHAALHSVDLVKKTYDPQSTALSLDALNLEVDAALDRQRERHRKHFGRLTKSLAHRSSPDVAGRGSPGTDD
jgi:hypothetical protein